MEKTILLEEIDPIDIYGINNRLFDLLASHYPKSRPWRAVPKST